MIYKTIKKLMLNKRWWTIPKLEAELKKRGLRPMQTTISARIRDVRYSLRKKGGDVEVVKCPDSKLYRYRVVM